MNTTSLKNKSKISILVVCALLLMGCWETVVDPVTGPIVPNFENNWSDAADPEHFIFLQNSDFGQSSGTITGEERHESIEALNQNAITGSYNELQIEFTILRGDGHLPITYSGTMTPASDEDASIIRIELASTEDTLILVPPQF